MTHAIPRSLPLLALLLVAFGCDKDKSPTTTIPDGTAAAESGSTDATATAEPSVPQEPDPPALAQGAHHYLVGNYEDVVALLEPLYGDLKAREQYRASGLAGGWLALAHAQIVFENGAEPSAHALAMADRTGDPEVVAIAKASHGALLKGNEDYAAAEQAFAAAARAAPQTLPSAVANILRGEALIGRAFGSSASDEIKDPVALETAKQAYADAKRMAEAGIETDVLIGRAEEGLAAIAKYQRNNGEACVHALEAVKRLQAAGASPYLIDGPQRLADELDCK